AASGVHPKLAQELARHSTITLTMDRYTHTAWENMAAALERLPDLAPIESVHQRMDGTDGGVVLASCLARNGASESHSVHPDAMKASGKPSPESAKNSGKTAVSSGKAEVRLLGLEPRTYGLKVRCSAD